MVELLRKSGDVVKELRISEVDSLSVAELRSRREGREREMISARRRLVEVLHREGT